MTDQSSNVHIRLSPNMRLQWEKAQDAHVLLYPEGMIQLNDSAAVILQLCDGTRSGAEIVRDLISRFGSASIANDVNEFLEAARGNGWIINV